MSIPLPVNGVYQEHNIYNALGKSGVVKRLIERDITGYVGVEGPKQQEGQ